MSCCCMTVTEATSVESSRSYTNNTYIGRKSKGLFRINVLYCNFLYSHHSPSGEVFNRISDDSCILHSALWIVLLEVPLLHWHMQVQSEGAEMKCIVLLSVQVRVLVEVIGTMYCIVPAALPCFLKGWAGFSWIGIQLRSTV